MPLQIYEIFFKTIESLSILRWLSAHFFIKTQRALRDLYKTERLTGGGKIYAPTRGKSFKVRISFKDAKTLKVRGSWGPISETVYWTKL